MTSIYLEKRIPMLNQQRFYSINVTRTLFGSWAMVREWGRIGHPGTVREKWFATEAEACEAGEQWRQWKEKRGYCAIGEAGYLCDNRDYGKQKFSDKLNTNYCFEKRSGESYRYVPVEDN